MTQLRGHCKFILSKNDLSTKLKICLCNFFIFEKAKKNPSDFVGRSEARNFNVDSQISRKIT